MNRSQLKDIDTIIYLMKKANAVSKHEPILKQEPQQRFMEYAKDLMSQVRDSRMSRWEVQHHLWAMHKTIQQRINEAEDRLIWIGR